MLAIDCESTGLYPYKNDFPFCITLADKNFTYFFRPEDRQEIVDRLDTVVTGHHIKFDVAMLLKIGIDLRGYKWHDTKVAARLIKNNLNGYSLDDLTGEKDDAVKKYISKNKLYTNIKLEGKKKPIRIEHYDKVPLEILEPYARKDARITYDLAIRQKEIIDKDPKMKELFELEMELLKVVFEMERIGILLDRVYVENAMKILKEKQDTLYKDYFNLTGESNPQAKKALIKALEEEIGVLPITDKGNPCANRKALEKVGGKVAGKILEIRDVQMKMGTFFSTYLFMQGKDNAIHATFDQAGTDTGRFSSNSPNLQQCHKEDDFPEVRSCFVPRTGYKLVSIDFDQMEFRLLLDLAKEDNVIDLILNNGYDVHKATAEVMSRACNHTITRDQAKTINFGLIYGMGAGKLANALKVDYTLAKVMRESYMKALPKSTEWMRKVMDYAQRNRQIESIYGRIYYFNDSFYKAVNYLIQGSCAGIIKRAMVECHKFLQNTDSRMLITCHDELVFEIHENEMEIKDDLKRIMETIYIPYRLPLTAKISIKKDNWNG